MVRQKSLEFSYKDISKIEELMEYILLCDFNSDKIYEMLEMFSRLKYISETISGSISVINDTDKDGNDPNVQFIDVTEFLFLEYILTQLEILHSWMDSVKMENQYHPKIEDLFNEVNLVIKKIRRLKAKDRFNF